MRKQGTGVRDQESGILRRFFAPETGARLVGPALILLAAVLATLPLILHGASCGHDFDFHLVSWLDAQNSWRHGLLYPHWAPSANFGAGEPRFIFYPPLTWMLGAALGSVLPWTLVPWALTFVLLTGTGLATRALARQALDDAPATLAGCFAIFSGYTLFTAYERTAFGELAGGVWIPLLLLFALRTRATKEPAHAPGQSPLRGAFDGSAFPLALVVAGAWLSNAPLGVMACYLLAFVALAAALLSRCWAPVLRAAVSAGLGIALTAFFLIPAAWEQRWVAINQATDDPGERIENSFLFSRHADPALTFHDVELHRVSLLAVSMLAVALLSLLVAWKRGKLASKRRWWVTLAMIPLAILILQLPVSLPIWNLLPKLRFLQFPWRWLVTLEAPMGIFCAAAVWPGKDAKRGLRNMVTGGFILLFAVASGFAARSFFQVCDDEDAVVPMLKAFHSRAGFPGTDEYAPPGVENNNSLADVSGACLAKDPNIPLEQDLPDGSPEAPDLFLKARNSICLPVVSSFAMDQETNQLNLDLPDAGYLILRLRSYPAWRLRLNGLPVLPSERSEDGLMALPVPKGKAALRVDWTTTPDALLGRWITALAALLLTALYLLERKHGNPRLSSRG